MDDATEPGTPTTPTTPTTPAAPATPATPATPWHRGPVVVGVATFATWLGFLAWDNQRNVDGLEESGPYQPWQVAAVVLVLGAVCAVALILRQDPWRVTVALSGTITGCMVLSFTILAPPAPDASMWPIGAMLILVAAGAGCLTLALVVQTARRFLVSTRSARSARR